jgi:hypothetical protein
VPFGPLDPGSGTGKKRGCGSGPGMNNPNNLSKRWKTYFVVQIFKLLDADVKNSDPGWKNSDTD